MLIKKVAILGGTGFVGRSLANSLAKSGYQIRIPTRNREKNRSDLILIPGLELVETNIHNQGDLEGILEGCDTVINLVGILNESGRKGKGFEIVHVELVKKIINACRTTGIKRLLHMSALNADVNGPSFYLKSKGQAEQLLAEATDNHFLTTCFRPSVIFGPGDSFMNRFAGLLRTMPLIFPLACPQARFCPVYVEDVVTAFCRMLKDPGSYGKHYELCGPVSYTLYELVAYVAKLIHVRRIIIPLPDWLSRIQAFCFDFLPGKPFSTDNYLSTRIDSLCKHNDLPGLGITPTALEAVAPSYLSGKTQRANYYRYRREVYRQHAQ